MSRIASWESLSALSSSFVDASLVRSSPLRHGATPPPRLTLYRDAFFWCPYCSKTESFLELKRIPYEREKVQMRCYGKKEPSFLALVPSGMLPAVQLNGRIITESDDILIALEGIYGPLYASMSDPRVLALRRLERALFREWCAWLCYPNSDHKETGFYRVAAQVNSALEEEEGPFFLSQLSVVECVFYPYLERMAASLFYYKGVDIKKMYPAIARWFAALEAEEVFRMQASDYHTHSKDLPPQMGGCYASGTPAQKQCAALVDHGPFHLVPDSSLPPPQGVAIEAVARVVKHHRAILEVNSDKDKQRMDAALRLVLSLLLQAGDTMDFSKAKLPSPPPAGCGSGLRYLLNRVNVPRDMSLHAARCLRAALEAVAAADGPEQGPPVPTEHRYDQVSTPFKQLI
jgi:glutathione S-transferase